MASQNRPTNFKAVVFDLDGTLLDTLPELAHVTNITLESHGFPTHTIDQYRHFIGDGAKMLITRALPEDHRKEATISTCLESFLDIYHEQCGNNVSAYPGIDEMLSRLQDRHIKMAILSNKPHHLTLKNVDLLLNQYPFETVFGERNGIPKKPDPAGADEIVTILGINPSEILYLGDTSIDMKTAVSAGMYPVGVLWGFRDKKELEDGGAQITIAHPSELFQLLD